MARASYKVLKDGKQIGTVVGYGKTYAAALATARRLAGAVTRAVNPKRKRRAPVRRRKKAKVRRGGKAKRRTTRAQVRRRRKKSKRRAPARRRRVRR